MVLILAPFNLVLPIEHCALIKNTNKEQNTQPPLFSFPLSFILLLSSPNPLFSSSPFSSLSLPSPTYTYIFHAAVMNEHMHSSEPKYKTKKDASEPSVVSPAKTNETTMAASTIDDDELERPTEAEEQCLRRVSGKVPWMAYSIAFVEMCERFSFFGTTAVCKFLLFLCGMWEKALTMCL